MSKPEKVQPWFAWDGDNLTPLGEHDGFISASYEADKLPRCQAWIFSKEALIDLQVQIEGVLK